jgi:FdhD protein
VEEPLEIRVGGKPVTVTMRTPGNDHDLAAGFLFTEGLVQERSDLRTIRRHPCNVVNVTLRAGSAFDTETLRRNFYVSSSCGVCGKGSIESVHLRFPPLESDIQLPGDLLPVLARQLRTAQPAFDLSGGLHAAAVIDATGKFLILREDVGRHNAVDKAIGAALLGRLLPLDRHILLVSGRASFEIVQKALAARIPVIAAVSAPSSLAVQFAEENGQTLIGFLRDHRMNLYTHPGRIVFPVT